MHDDAGMTFGETLRKRREEEHLTRRALEDLTGISQRQLEYLEKDAKDPRRETLEVLAAVLGPQIIAAAFPRMRGQVTQSPGHARTGVCRCLVIMVPTVLPTPHGGLRPGENPYHNPLMALPDSFAMLEQWADLMKANDLADSTIHAYLYGMWSLIAFLGFHLHVLEVTEAHIAAFLAAQGRRSTSKEQYAKGIRSFYQWAHRRGYLSVNPVAMIQPKRVQRPVPVRFEQEELTRLLIAAAWRDPRRAWAILACLCLGTRRTEFVSIRLADIDWGRKVVTLRFTKGRRPRTVDLSPWAEESMRELLAWSDDERLVPIEPNTLNNWVHDAVRDTGLGHEVGGRHRTAHTLRATFVSTLLDEGIPPHVVGAIVGHQSLATTSVYAAIGTRHTTKDAVQIFGPSIAVG